MDIFLHFFSDLFNIVFALVFLLVGLIIGIIFRPGWGNVVMKIMPKESRFVDFGIREETAISIECDDKRGYVPHRFIKLAPGFVGRVGRFIKRQQTRYIGKEGTAYTWQLKNEKLVKVGDLATALKGIWGEDAYKMIPDAQKETLEKSSIMVTVDLKDGLTPAGMRSISEEDIKREEDRQAAKTFWAGKKDVVKSGLFQGLIYAIAGFGICAVLVILGVLDIPDPQPPPQAAAVVLQTLKNILLQGLM